MDVRFYHLFLLVQLLFAISALTQDATVKVCARPGLVNPCQQIGRNHELECVNNLHSVDCMLNIENGVTTFGSVKAREAVLGARRTKNIVVVGEIKSIDGTKPYQTVVIIKDGAINDGFQNFHSKKYCHPGFQFDKYVSDYVLEEFENKIIESNKLNICTNVKGTLTEKYIKGLADYFGPSCRPGHWVTDDDFDAELKKKYKSLCELCDSRSCSQKSTNPFQQSLDCLVKQNADVALTTLYEARIFFNQTENFNNYKYLCPDGSVNTAEIPCTWTNEVWDLIVADRNIASELKNKLENWIKKAILQPGPSPFGTRNLPSDLFADYLLEILDIDVITKGVNLTNNYPSLLEYVEGFQKIPNEKSKRCDIDTKWCTTSDIEQEKCLWLAQAALNSAIQPVITCSKSNSKIECLEEIQTNKTDVVTIDANYGYIAKRKNLDAVAFPETNSKSRLNILTVIKDGDANINRFENLKNKKACFPEYGGIEWLAWIDVARTKGILSKNSCDYGKLISDFVDDSCMPAANSNDHEVTEGTDKAKLCRLCQQSPSSRTNFNCDAGPGNSFYGINGSLRCLKLAGDFAVISKNASFQIEDNSLRVLCKNGSLAAYPGLNVDSECAIAIITESEVVTRRISDKRQDIILTLGELERRFGQESNKPFEVFNEFSGVKDLLFKDSTPGLDFENSNDPYVKAYISLFKHIDQCAADGKSAAVTLKALPLIGLSILTCVLIWK